MTKIHYKNRLPHIAPIGAKFFVTFHLGDALPVHVLYELKEELSINIRKLQKEKPENYKYQLYKLKKTFYRKYDLQLHHKPYGNCYLKNEKVAQTVTGRIQKFDGSYYNLEAYTIMPNHVHLLIDTDIQLEKDNIEWEGETPKGYVQLDKIMQLIKGGSSFEANRILGRSGTFWMKDSYDHYIRDDREWGEILEYIIYNPVSAGLVDD